MRTSTSQKLLLLIISSCLIVNVQGLYIPGFIKVLVIFIGDEVIKPIFNWDDDDDDDEESEDDKENNNDNNSNNSNKPIQEETIDDDDDCTIDGLFACTREHDPYICGDRCTYDNSCIAENSKFNFTTDCKRKKFQGLDVGNDNDIVFEETSNNENNMNTNGDNNNNNYNNNNDNCPSMNDKKAIMCNTMEYEPVICDDNDKKCRYDNRCIAEVSGYTEFDVECRYVGISNPFYTGDSVNNNNNNNECPKQGNIVCPAVHIPVICDDICIYSNMCIAKGAGYKDGNCKKI